MDEKKIIDPTGAELRPGDPKNCQGNGQHPPYECCCDECDHYLACYSENSEGEYMVMDDNEEMTDEEFKEYIQKKYGDEKCSPEWDVHGPFDSIE